MKSSRFFGYLLVLAIGGGAGFVAATAARAPERGDPTRERLLAELREAQEALDRARANGTDLSGPPPLLTVTPTPSIVTPTTAMGGPENVESRNDRRVRLESAWAEYLAAEANLRPEDKRVPFPKSTPSDQLWGPLPRVMDLLRDEDADAYSAWRIEKDGALLRKYVRVSATDRDLDQFRPILTAFYDEQVRHLFEARRSWEDPNATAEERVQRRRAYDLSYTDAAEKRNRKITELGQSIGRLDTAGQPFASYPP